MGYTDCRRDDGIQVDLQTIVIRASHNFEALGNRREFFIEVAEDSKAQAIARLQNLYDQHARIHATI